MNLPCHETCINCDSAKNIGSGELCWPCKLKEYEVKYYENCKMCDVKIKSYRIWLCKSCMSKCCVFCKEIKDDPKHKWCTKCAI
jgi:hypothetical protein